MRESTHCVVGTGPTAVACAKALLARGAKVLMLDAGLELEADRADRVRQLAAQEPERWDPKLVASVKSSQIAGSTGLPDKLLFGSDFIYRDTAKWIPWHGERVALKPSLALGGLSNVWGAAMLPYSDVDIPDWPVRNERLKAHYEAVAQFTGLAWKADDLGDWFPLAETHFAPVRASRQAEMILGRLQIHRDSLHRTGWRFGKARVAVNGRNCRYCGLCINGCPYNCIYNSAETVREMQRNNDFSLRTGVLVNRVVNLKDEATVYAADMVTGAEISYVVRRVYLAAGVIPTAQIVLRSRSLYDQSILLKDSQYFLFPIVLARGVPDVRSEPLYTLSQVFLELRRPEVSRYTVHLQLYTYSDFIGASLRRSLGALGPAREPLARWLEKRLIIAQGYLHSDESCPIEMTLRRDGHKDCLRLRAMQDRIPRQTIKRVLVELAKNARALGGVPLSSKLEIPPPGRSFHNGSSFPMREHPGPLETDILGRLPGWENIHLADASVLPSIPATTITFSAMANAHRIGWESATL